jgi:hypothetical protein
VSEAEPAPLAGNVSEAPPALPQVPEAWKATLVSQADSQAPNAAASRVSPLKSPTPAARVPAAPSGSAGSLIWLVFVAAAAFAVAYFVISYYRMQSMPDAGAQPSSATPLPATS